MGFLQGSLLAIVLVVAVSYLFYMVGLIKVLRRLDRLTWHAFVPLLNYYAQVRAIGAPRRWFGLSLIPYIGTVYAGSIAIRLGGIFGKKATSSLFWLTFGAPVGMFVIARSPTLNRELLNKPIKLVDVREIRRRLIRNQN